MPHGHGQALYSTAYPGAVLDEMDVSMHGLSDNTVSALVGLFFAVNYVVGSFCPNNHLTCFSLFLQVLLHYAYNHLSTALSATQDRTG